MRPSASPRAGRPTAQTVLAALIAAACFAATIPLGSVARWASATVVLASAALAFTAWFLGATARAHTAGAPWNRAERAVLAALLGWAALQLLPLPRAWLVAAQPLAAEPLAQMLGDSLRAPLAVNPSATGSALTLWLAYALLANTTRKVLCGRTAARHFTALLAIAGTAQACWGLLGLHHAAAATFSAAGTRLVGTFSSGNAFGGYLLLTLLATTGLLLHTVQQTVTHNPTPPRRARPSRPRASWLTALLLATAIAIQLVALLQSGSRGATLAAAAGLATLILGFAASRNRTGRALTFIAIAVLGGLVAWIAASGNFAQLAYRFRGIWETPHLAAIPRLQIWSAALNLLATHPLGVGLGGFEDAFLQFQPAGFQFARVLHAHNDWLQGLIELGLPGGAFLFGALAVIARRLAPLFRAGAPSENRWLWRGLAAAWFATLAHAFVDFNLSARPGVALTAFAILGAALAGADRVRRHASASDPATTPRSSRWRPATRIALVILAALLLAREQRCARASRLAETGAVGLGLAPDPYAWLPAPALTPAAAEARLLRAVALAPNHARTRYVAALAHLEAFRQRRAATHAEAAARNLPLSPAALRRSVATAMRAEEVARCRELEPQLETAARLAPWDADVRALLGEVQLRAGTALGLNGTQTVARALAELDRAVALAPTDLTVLARVTRALAETLDANPIAAIRPACRARLWIAGRRTLEITGANVDACFALWAMAGIPPERAPLSPDMPEDVLRGIVRHFDRTDNGPMALAALDALARHQATRDTASARLPPWQRQARERAWMQRVHDQARWNLRLGRWDAYRALAPERAAVFAAVLAQQTRNLDAPDVSPVLVRIGLEDVLRTHGLNLPQRLRLCRLRLDNGDATAASRLLAETTLAANAEALPTLRAWLADTPARPADDYARRLIEARLLLADHQHAPAVALLAALIADPALPPPISQAIRPWHAEALRASGQPVPADALPHTDTPPIRLDVHYRGGALILRGLDLLSPAPPRPGMPNEVHLYWTLHHRVDANLAVRVRFLDRQGRETFARRVSFEQAAPRQFGAGNPRLGETILMSVPLPAATPEYARLSIQVTGGAKPGTISTDERLLAVEIDPWTSLAHTDSMK